MKNDITPQAPQCDGSCQEHRGQVRRVKVSAKWLPMPWYFNYCEEAIEIDEQAGFTVDELKETDTMKNETPAQTLIGRFTSNEPQEYRIATRAKALMKGGEFIDAGILSTGIYTSQLPYLFSQETTIETLIDRAKNMKYGNGDGECWFDAEYFENLRSCELVEVYIAIPS